MTDKLVLIKIKHICLGKKTKSEKQKPSQAKSRQTINKEKVWGKKKENWIYRK